MQFGPLVALLAAACWRNKLRLGMHRDHALLMLQLVVYVSPQNNLVRGTGIEFEIRVIILVLVTICQEDLFLLHVNVKA